MFSGGVLSIISLSWWAEVQSGWKLQPRARRAAKESKSLPAASSALLSVLCEPLGAFSAALSCRPRWRRPSSSTLQTGKTAAASYCQTWRRACAFQVKRCFSEDLLEVQSATPLTFLYVSLRRQENHSQRAGNQQKPVRVTNELSFPLATAPSDRAVDAAVYVRLREQEATGGLPIFSLNQWSRNCTMSEVLFRRCGLGNLNASSARRPPTQTGRILLQQQETIINDEASGPERLFVGGSVCEHSFSLYLGKCFCLLVSLQGGRLSLIKQNRSWPSFWLRKKKKKKVPSG